MMFEVLFVLILGLFAWGAYFIAGKLCYALKRNNYKNATAIQFLTTLVIFVLLVFIAFLILLSNVRWGC